MNLTPDSKLNSITFIFLGSKLPRYAHASLRLAAKHSGLNIHLVGNGSLYKTIRGQQVNFTAVEDFYDGSGFRDAAKRVMFPHSFRDGFWLKSLERLFVLEQYMSAFKLSSVLHSELDQLLFRVDILASKLESIKHTGLFLPFHTRESAVASIFYCNRLATLESLLNFARTGEVFQNEMALIAKWAEIQPQHVTALPTISTIWNPDSFSEVLACKSLSKNKVGGLLDAAQLGQWVGGIDPRNIRLRDHPRIHFVDNPKPLLASYEQLQTLKFDLDKSDGSLLVRSGPYAPIRIYNLHMHSKVHSWLAKGDNNLQTLLKNGNGSQATKFRAARSIQLTDFVVKRAIGAINNPEKVFEKTRRELYRRSGYRPVASPFISGDAFRQLAQFKFDRAADFRSLPAVQPGQIVFCQGDVFGLFKERILDGIDFPITILIGNSMGRLDSSLFSGLGFGKSVSVYAQNLDEKINGVEPLPLGLENIQYNSNRGIYKSSFGAICNKPRLDRAYWSFDISINPEVRVPAANDLLGWGAADRVNVSGPSQEHSRMLEYAFIAVPPGVNVDSFTLWESMYSGCIPIVLSSHYTRILDSLELPVLLVDSYTELHDIDEKELSQLRLKLNYRFTSEALWTPYWIQRINESLGLI